MMIFQILKLYFKMLLVHSIQIYLLNRHGLRILTFFVRTTELDARDHNAATDSCRF
jgi:hypothetical protein